MPPPIPSEPADIHPVPQPGPTQFTSTYPMHGEVFLRAPSEPGQKKMHARIAAITFAGTGETYSIRYADGTLLEVGVHEIDSDTT